MNVKFKGDNGICSLYIIRRFSLPLSVRRFRLLSVNETRELVGRKIDLDNESLLLRNELIVLFSNLTYIDSDSRSNFFNCFLGLLRSYSCTVSQYLRQIFSIRQKLFNSEPDRIEMLNKVFSELQFVSEIKQTEREMQ